MKVSFIFDFFYVHKYIRRAILIALTIIAAGLMITLHFSEDISDFLPLGTKEREEMSIYQDISGADKLLIIFSDSEDADYIVEAVGRYKDIVLENDVRGWCDFSSGQGDLSTVTAVADFVYDNAPFFMTEADFERADSLLSLPGYIKRTMEADRNALMFPTSPLVSRAIARDPLGLFSPVSARLQTSGAQSAFQIYEDCIFTPDMGRAILIMTSPFGNSETESNTELVNLLEQSASILSSEFPDVSVDVVGGPAIAVSNSSRIKKDSILAVSLSVVLIILLLVYSFNSARNILLIFMSVGWGMLFALGGMAVFSERVSIIVIGISSVILGIAVNYPLHLIAHLEHQPDKRLAMKEIVAPLVVGNITTVGAFLALVPLKSTALRDLGLFASLLLVGTILFVIVFLPHYACPALKRNSSHRLLNRLAGFSPENNRGIVIAAAIVTAVLSVFSMRTGFDTDMSNINYMTQQQRLDMQYFEDLMSRDTSHTATTVYVYASGDNRDQALAGFDGLLDGIDSLERAGLIGRQNYFDSFIVSEQVQQKRLEQWKRIVNNHSGQLTLTLRQEALNHGFSQSAFDRFFNLVDDVDRLRPHSVDYFTPLMQTVFMQNSTESSDGDSSYIVEALNVENENIAQVKEVFGDNCFDVAGMNGALTSSLSDNFNYIGWACSLIVFFFLWFSFGRIELALISFLPMAISWVWILGIMAVFHIKFNIVNVILATFIFGQGDDYTIFMTEGCQWEYARKKSILLSYKSSILQSAAIMFVGIGTLIVAKHPAMRSLAQVTVIGMFSVVLMAYLVPPLMFRWLTTSNGCTRKYPLTIKKILRGSPRTIQESVLARYAYKGKEIERTVRRNMKEKGSAVLDMDFKSSNLIEINDSGYGELAILTALAYPDSSVIATLQDEEHMLIACIAAEDFVSNIKFKI